MCFSLESAGKRSACRHHNLFILRGFNLRWSLSLFLEAIEGLASGTQGGRHALWCQQESRRDYDSGVVYLVLSL